MLIKDVFSLPLVVYYGFLSKDIPLMVNVPVGIHESGAINPPSMALYCGSHL